MHTPIRMRNFGFFARSKSVSGCLRVEISTWASASISSSVRCRINNGLPLHFIFMLRPSGMSDNLTSTFAKATTSAAGLRLPTIPLTTAFAVYVAATAPAKHERVQNNTDICALETKGTDLRNIHLNFLTT